MAPDCSAACYPCRQDFFGPDRVAEVDPVERAARAFPELLDPVASVQRNSRCRAVESQFSRSVIDAACPSEVVSRGACRA